MDENHILTLNIGKVMRCLTPLLPAAQVEALHEEIRHNVRQLIRLAYVHLRFAQGAAGHNAWRQKVSRGYYACYIASRAIRLAVNNVYSTDAGDHKKIADLPTAFPHADVWHEFLVKFRGDRNLSDYDHTAGYRDLELPSDVYVTKAAEFLAVTKQYLADRGDI